MIGGYAGSKVQEPFLTDQFKQTLEQSTQEHPVASFVGDVVPSLGAMTTDFSQLGKVIGLGSKFLRGQSLSTPLARTAEEAARLGTAGTVMNEAEKAALYNVAANFGVGSGVSGGMQLMQGGEFSVPRMLAEGAANALISKPRRWAEKFFPQAPVEVPAPEVQDMTGRQPPPIPVQRPENIPVPALTDVLLSKRGQALEEKFGKASPAAEKYPPVDIGVPAIERARRIDKLTRPEVYPQEIQKEIGERAKLQEAEVEAKRQEAGQKEYEAKTTGSWHSSERSELPSS